MTLRNLDGLKDTYERTGSIYECAKIYNCSINAIAMNLKKMGVPRYGRTKNKFPLTNLVEVYRELRSFRKVAKHFGCSASLIQTRLENMDIVTSGKNKGERFNE